MSILIRIFTSQTPPMKHFLLPVLLLVLSFHTTAQNRNIDRPRLVVGIVVDQMRWDYLYKFYDRYGDKGFKRLMNDGFNCQQTMINYIPSYTAPGHACIYTGSVPSINGMAGNDWIDNYTGKYWYCVEDTSVTSIGSSSKAGKMSPRTLLTSTITDELRLATNMRSRVYGISLKDRGAILPAGHLGNGAFWYDDATGGLISSSYYGSALPNWLVAFNNKHLSDSMLRKDWALLYEPGSYKQSTSDNNSYEGKNRGEDGPVFPHRVSRDISYYTLRKTPAGNTYTFSAAKACVEGAQMGTSGFTDFLCISLSATDYIGHQYGPDAIEIEDTYLRLDKDIADFLSYLDNRLGKGNYLLFLSADHGAAHNSIYLNDMKMPAGNESEMKIRSDLATYLRTEMGGDSGVASIENYQIVMNEPYIKSSGTDRFRLRNKIINWLYQRPEVAYVIDMEHISQSPVPEPILQMAINGYNRRRSGSIQIIYQPGWYSGYAPTGTTHGTWHPYDTHIPLLWYGWKIPKGSSDATVHMEDISATLAALLHIQMPNGCIGTPIPAIVK
jgi:predicted AlkP superfamily pyrophosphatase or phosphodiesterase